MLQKRCPWPGHHPLYISYHDNEWGKPVYDDQTFFEFLILETFQAGLSWITILNKRENFRRSFHQFDYKKIGTYDQKYEESLMADKGIIRHRLKIKSAINNANAFQRVQKGYGSFSNYIWSFVDHRPIINHYTNMKDVPANTPLSHAISKDLKRKGFTFTGSTVVYAYLQSCGIVNDHLTSCFCHPDNSGQ